ncbi:hypothetical protein DC31_00235 [Microbacterium sp. CH12i]|uniref:SAF domain-containing protein n=1 Tax=Microbacterium sp. CH12i TaxID=1479651 RepID=UPI000461A440|nr:SAF domain-containing protein [Microbacterium sp. CH12i]KDA06953.1 hypothetical protein DC31_00235 [Microbacterium sp. CH12i]
MTTTAPETTKKRARNSGSNGEKVPPRPAAVGQPTKSRRRIWMIALGITIVLIGALATWYVTTTTSQTVSVLTIKSDVQRGEAITQEDLTTISIAGGQSTDTLTASQASTVVGQVAAVDLPAGSLVTSANVLDTLPVPENHSIVGIALTTSQLPSYRLSAGDAVRLVDTPVAQGEPPTEDPTTFKATVFTSTYDETNQVWIIDVVVPTREAASIAARAATQRVSIVLDGVGE